MSRALTRCVVTLEASLEHRKPEELLSERIDAAAGRIEVLFDELEEGGRHFLSPTAPGFAPPKLAVEQRGDETCRVEFVCTPPMTRAETQDLAHRVAVLLAGPLDLGQLPDLTPRGTPVVGQLGSDADTDPGEGPRSNDVPTRAHGAPATRRREEVPTRPEGVIAISRKAPADEEPEEVTAPHRRDELPTRPEGVMAIKRPRNGDKS